MKKTNRITLGVMGTLFLSACTQQPDTMRNTYRTKEDCVADYSESQCSQNNQGYGSSSHWYGPSYRRNDPTIRPDNAGPGRDPSRPLTRETITRGGFGEFGRSFFRGS